MKITDIIKKTEEMTADWVWKGMKPYLEWKKKLSSQGKE